MNVDKPATCYNKSCSNPGVKQCTKYHFIKFCGRKCQVAHWKQHKILCDVILCPLKRARFQQAYGNNGDDLCKRQQYDEALIEYRKDLDIPSKLLGENYHFTAECYQRIGRALRDNGQYEEALVEFRKALAIC